MVAMVCLVSLVPDDLPLPLISYWSPFSLYIVGPKWPAYSLAEPQLMVFDVNMTDLATPIADTYRAEQIQYINDNLGPLGRK